MVPLCPAALAGEDGVHSRSRLRSSTIGREARNGRREPSFQRHHHSRLALLALTLAADTVSAMTTQNSPTPNNDSDVARCQTCGGRIVFIDWRPMVRGLIAVDGGVVRLTADASEGRKAGHSDDHFECSECGAWIDEQSLVDETVSIVALRIG